MYCVLLKQEYNCEAQALLWVCVSVQDAFSAILLHLSHSINHWIIFSQPLTPLLSSSLTPANRHVFSSIPHSSLHGHLWDRRDCTSTLPFRVSLPRMLQLCHLHGRVWTSHWRTRVWLWIIHLEEQRGWSKLSSSLFFVLPVCLFLLVDALMSLSAPV